MGDCDRMNEATADPAGRKKVRLAAHDLSVTRRIGVMLVNYIPLLLAIGLGLTLLIPWAPLGQRTLAAVAELYLLPPLLARLVLLVRRPSGNAIAMGSGDFFAWWLLLNLQTIFCRFPALEELLRLVPTLYSAWLRLWGSRIGSLIYWAPGTLVLDRSYLDIGDNVVFGAGVRLNPHVIARNEKGVAELILAPVRIGEGAAVGGYSLLTAGTEIAANESTRACLLSPPFTRWKGGQRERIADSPAP
jgi:hypothetical protein